MRLIGSKMENDFREELKTSNKDLNTPSRLGNALISEGHSTLNAFVLHWTPDQCEDLYVILIDGSYLVSVELNRLTQKARPVFEYIKLADYQKGLSKMNQVRLLVAQELVSAET